MSRMSECIRVACFHLRANRCRRQLAPYSPTCRNCRAGLVYSKALDSLYLSFLRLERPSARLSRTRSSTRRLPRTARKARARRTLYHVRIRRDKTELRHEALFPREDSLVDGGSRPEGRLHGQGLAALDVLPHETLTLPGNRPAKVTGDRVIAALDLRAPIVDVERVDSERSHREVGRLAAAGRTRDHDHPRARHAASPGLERRVRVRQHVRRKLGGHELSLGIDDPEAFETGAGCRVRDFGERARRRRSGSLRSRGAARARRALRPEDDRRAALRTAPHVVKLRPASPPSPRAGGSRSFVRAWYPWCNAEWGFFLLGVRSAAHLGVRG